MEDTKKKEKILKEDKTRSKVNKTAKTGTKISTGTKFKERWLLTRKTWRYMSDAGKKLFPDGTNPHKKEDVPKVEEHFQEISEKCGEYILWNPNRKKSVGYDYGIDDEGKCEPDDPLEGTSGLHSFDPPKEKLFPTSELGWGLPSEIYNTLLRNYGASTLHRVASKLLEEQFMEEDEFGYDDDGGEYLEIDGRKMRSIGTQTDPYLDMCVQTDHDGNAEDDVSVGAETRAETEAAVAQQRALMQQQQLLLQQQQQEHQHLEQQEQQQRHHQQKQQRSHHYHRQQSVKEDQQPQFGTISQVYQQPLLAAQIHTKELEIGDLNLESIYAQQCTVDMNILQQELDEIQSDNQIAALQGHAQQQHAHTQQQTQKLSELDQSYQSQRPVLKKFWARRESLTAKSESQHSQAEKIGRIAEKVQLSVDKEKEIGQQRGIVAAKLSSLEATTSTGAPILPVGQQKQEQLKQDQAKQEKKKQNVFKLGLKCDVESQPGSSKISIEKAAMDKFKTVNYDKTLRNIKSKWVPTAEEEEYIRSLEKENELERERVIDLKLKEKESVKRKEREERRKEKEREKEMIKEKLREKEKTKKKARSIQVGEPLPQFILNSFRINSPVEIIHATRRKLRRFSTKAESVSGSESSMPPSGMVSPRFSISVLDDQGARDLVVSEAEAYKLSQMGIPFVYKRPSVESSLEGDAESGAKETTPHYFQRSLSAVQASGHISQLLYHLRASKLSNPLWGGSSHLGGRSSDRAQRLTQSLLQYLLPAVMQRSRGSGGGHASRLVAKRIWRTRSKSQSRASAGTTSIWTPMGNCTWMSVTGRVSTLESTPLIHLSELERLSLQRISLAKLQALNLGCHIKVPKETSTAIPNKKRRPYLLKRKALSSGLFDGKKEEHKGPSGGLVFGLALNKCIENERIRAAEREALALAAASTPSGEEGDGSLSRKSSQAGSNASFTSLLEGAKQSTTGSLESLNLERKRPSLGGSDALMGGSPASLDLLNVDPVPQVPALVNNCCKFLEGHGLHTLGIFRVSSSKKRVRQLREEFDSGKEIVLSEEHCPHDIATLLKEFFRDLPEPLLTRELYEPLLCTQKIRNRKLQFEALQFIVQLLPKANRDTLFSLLNFLTTVADHSSDSECDAGQGNKMDSNNLATLFAPNILHQIKPGSDSLSTSEMAAQAEERIDVINVVRSMIDHNKELFEVTTELLDETYQHLMDTHPEALDILLRRRCTGMDERGQKHVQQLLSTLLDPSGMKRIISPTFSSPPLSPTSGQGLDLEIDTSSSVFEGSEASSPLPRSPTDHHEFEKLRSSIVIEDSEAFRRDGPSAQEISNERTRRRRRHEEEEGRRQSQENRSSGEGPTEERGWFRRREKSGSRELEKGIDHVPEKTSWFRRREKSSPKSREDKAMSRQGSDKSKDKAPMRPDPIKGRERLSSQEYIESPSERRSRILSEEKLRVPEPSVRRLSSPEIDTFGVITASLKIPVPLQQQSAALAFTKETDISYMEESKLSEEAKLRLKNGTTVASSRQRTGSNDSFLGQPITGSMSFQPLTKKDGDKQSYDSVLSSSSMGVYTMSPSERNTPSSDFHYGSGTSSPMSAGALSPPLWLSPDSGTPGLSPPTSPPPQRRRGRRKEESTSKPVPLTHSATHTFGSKPSAPIRTREKTRVQPAPIGRSRTTDSMKIEANIELKASEPRIRHDGSRSRVSIEKESNKKYIRKKYSAERHHSGHLPDLPSRTARASTAESTTQLWKRWEIIASDPTEPETFV